MTTSQPPKPLVVSFPFLCLLLLGSAVTSFGQATLSGTVKDSSGAAIAGATVTARNTASGTSYTVSADSEGKYELKDVASGPYRVTASSLGFSDLGVNLSVEASGNATQDFTLSAGSLQDEVTVTAAKGLRAAAEIPQAITVVGALELETRRPIGVAEAYERTPSVNQTDPNPQRARPTIRGFQSSRLLIAVDGERLNNQRFAADFVGVSPSLVDITQIESVEVVAGSGSSLYGSDAIGGTINIITKGPQRAIGTEHRLDARLDTDFSSNSRFRRGGLALGYGEDWFGVRVNYARFLNPNYRMGGTAITRDEVIRFGRFAVQAGTAAGQTGAGLINAYPVFSLPANTEISNSGGNGQIGGADFIMFPSERQNLRLRYSLNRYGDLGVPWSEFPTTTNRANTGFSDFDKFSARYELRDITSWFPRLSASIFWQKYRRQLDEIRYNIPADNPAAGINSSYATVIVSPGPPPVTRSDFTGKDSARLLLADAHTLNSNETTGFDVQMNFLPWKNAIYITGVNHSLDRNRDRFDETRFSVGGPPGTPPIGTVTSRLIDVRNTPYSDYKNYGWYNQLEQNTKYVRLVGGFRVDNWRTVANPTPGFPVGTLRALSAALVPAIQANPGSLNASGLSGLTALATGSGALNTSNTITTYNIGATLLFGGFNPYARFSTSYREPDTTSRYLIRNFSTSPVFSLPSLINAGLKPEKGKDIDVGIKINKQKVRAMFGFYRNVLNDATGTANNGYCIAANPAQGIIATGPPFCPQPTQHFAQVFQTINFSQVVTRGFETMIEADVSLGSAGSLTPLFTFSTLRAQNKNPDATRLAVIRAVYNSSAPLELEGSPTDVPFYSLPNWQGTVAPRFTSKNGRVWGEYEYRFTSKITRVDPNEISFAGTTQYAFFASYKGIQKHTIRGGFTLGKENPMRISLGVENFTNRLYFLPFQPGPAPGRSFTVGTTIPLSKKW
jgi:outer membrane receptor protein involved in Fe transport